MRELQFKTIPMSHQRYPTVGDYWIDKEGVLQVRVSVMNNRYEFLILIHELIEWFLTEQRGIKCEDIDAYDINYENHRQNQSLAEPGDNKDAPYYKEHQFATGIERVLANELCVDWNEYNDYVDEL